MERTEGRVRGGGANVLLQIRNGFKAPNNTTIDKIKVTSSMEYNHYIKGYISNSKSGSTFKTITIN